MTTIYTSPGIKMKFLAVLFFIFSFQLKGYADCKIATSSFKFFNASGIIDWDSKTDEIVKVFPEIEYYGPELPDKVNITIELAGSCNSESKLELRIYGYRSVYRMMGGETEHGLHGSVPEGSWTSSLSSYSVIQKPFDTKTTLEFNNVDMKKVWSSVDDFFWYWRINHKLYLINNGKEQLIGEKMIPSPLIH
jgi:hypothetical protein